MRKKFTEDIELRNAILIQLQENKEKTGYPYCPCVNPLNWNEDYVCPCKNFREAIPIGEECHCGLYIKLYEEE